MFDHPVLKVLCWVFAFIAVFGGVNYLFIAQNKDLVPKISKSTNGRKALYYTVGLATVCLFALKLFHYYNQSQTSSYYY